MSYAYAGKIAGLGAFRGFGDAAYDQAYAAYQADHALWVQQKTAHDNAVQAYAAAASGVAAGNASAQAAYQRDLAAWNTEATGRAAAAAAATQQQMRLDQQAAQANAAAAAAGAVFPAGYAGCVTQAQHNGWQSACSALNTTVKGLGADPTGPSCALALLPVCGPRLPMPAPLRPQPQPPTPQGLPVAPPVPLRPEPQPPVASAVPNSPLGPDPGTAITSPAPSLAPPTPTKSAGLIKNGLILVVLAGGGYALYRTFKKPRAA